MSDEEIDLLRSDYLRRTTRLKLVDTKIFKIPKAFSSDNSTYIVNDKKQENLLNNISLNNLKIYNKLNRFLNSKDYYKLNRVLNLLYAISIYKDESLNHGVVLTSFNINKDCNYVTDKEVENFVKYLDPNIKCFFVNSNNYDDMFKKANKCYCDNKKSLIFTTYANLSTGQNLSFQLDVDDLGNLQSTDRNNNTTFIEPNGEGIGDFTKVDIDFLYLSDITNVGIRDVDCFQSSSRKENLQNRVKYIYQIERADCLGAYFNVEEKEKDLGRLSIFNSNKHKSSYNKLDWSWEIYRATDQSVGRSSRNARSHDKRVICAMDSLIDPNLYKNVIREDLVSREVDTLLSFSTSNKHIINMPIMGGIDIKSKKFEDYIEKLAVDIRLNPNSSNIAEFEDLRSKNLLFPFYKTEDEISNISLKDDIFFNVKSACRNIYVDSSDKHFDTKDDNKKYITIGPDANFIKDLLTNSLIRNILFEENIKVPKNFEEFKLFPVKSFFINVTKGFWGEFFGERVLNKYLSFEIEDLEEDIYEIADSKIVTDDKVIFLDYKNFSSRNLQDYNDSKFLKKKALNKIDLIRKRINTYDNKEIYFCYLNLYSDSDSTRVIDLGENIYDLGSLFYRDRYNGVIYSGVDKKIRGILC